MPDLTASSNDLSDQIIENQTVVNTNDGVISQCFTVQDKALLNVGGVRHEVLWDTLLRFPLTRLGRLAQCRSSEIKFVDLCDSYDRNRGEFFFDREPSSFMSVINFYRTGKLHLVKDLCVISFYEDLIYWNIDECYLQRCCQNKYYQEKEQIFDEIEKEIELIKCKNEQEDFGHGRCSNVRRKIWTLFEDPHTSKAGRIIAVISILFIVLSSVVMTISTIEGFGCKFQATDMNRNENHCEELFVPFLLEAICISWFTIEYLVRLYAAPSKLKFFKGVLNGIDLLAIVPFYVSVILEKWNVANLHDFKSVQKALQVFRVFRIVRVLKLARHSKGLKSLGQTLVRSYRELGMLLVFLAVLVLMFGSLGYFAEKEENSEQFRSIPHAFWWACITMTTVGYGDMYPKTVWGKLIGAVCCLGGVLVIALPIPVIVNNFTEFYSVQARIEKAIKRQEAANRKNETVTVIQESYDIMKGESDHAQQTLLDETNMVNHV